MTQRLPCFAFAEAKPAQRLERPSLNARRGRRREQAVWGAIGVAEHEARRQRSLDSQLAVVQCEVMSGAQGNEIRSVVSAPIRARLQMMDVHPTGVRTAWHLAAVMVASKHLAPHRWRDILLRRDVGHHGGSWVRCCAQDEMAWLAT